MLFGFLPCLCGMSAKFMDADNEAAVVWPTETKMLYMETMVKVSQGLDQSAWPGSQRWR